MIGFTGTFGGWQLSTCGGRHSRICAAGRRREISDIATGSTRAQLAAEVDATGSRIRTARRPRTAADGARLLKACDI